MPRESSLSVMVAWTCAALIGVTSVGWTPAVASEEQLYIVKDGQANSVIVIDGKSSPVIDLAVAELQYHLHRASGVELPVVEAKEAAELPADQVRIIIGNGELAEAMGVHVEQLPVETYIIKTEGNQLLFAGHDSQVASYRYVLRQWNVATMWAVTYYLDQELGVRWLWPGEVGTYVPQRKDIPLPHLDISRRPILETRSFGHPLHTRRSRDGSRLILDDDEYEKVSAEGLAWQRRHQLGSRSHLRFGHAFKDWWEKYHAERPDFFAVPPEGVSYADLTDVAKRAKLNVGNPDVRAAIIAEWQEAGAPDFWNVCPNDGTRFDTSDASRAMDVPADQSPEDIWAGRANLTARYVRFWNQLIVEMREINPDVVLCSYAYGAYRDPPPMGIELEEGVLLQIVPTYWAYDAWKGWQQAGVSGLFLRPNWWWSGAVAPVIPLQRQGEFFRFAMENQMRGFAFDQLHGRWGTMGPLYYTITRLSVHPEMTVDEVIDEYCSAFGNAASTIKEYLTYWEDYTEKAAHTVNAGGVISQPQRGIYEEELEKRNLSTSALAGSWLALPYLYTDDILAPAYAILDRADRLAEGDDPYVPQRIQVLRSGLDHLRLTRDVLELGYAPSLTADEKAKYLELVEQLQELRHELTPQHVVWGEVENATEVRRNIPTTPGQASWQDEDLDGM